MKRTNLQPQTTPNETAHTMPRNRLPNRRASESLELQTYRQDYSVTISLSGSKIREVFVDPKKPDSSDLCNIIHDVSVLLSIALQWGVPLGELQRATLRLCDNTPASPIGAILDTLLSHQQEPH